VIVILIQVSSKKTIQIQSCFAQKHKHLQGIQSWPCLCSPLAHTGKWSGERTHNAQAIVTTSHHHLESLCNVWVKKECIKTVRHMKWAVKCVERRWTSLHQRV